MPARVPARVFAIASAVITAGALTGPAVAASPDSAADVYSSNWSGYAASGSVGDYAAVSATWIQPAVTCGSTNSYSSFWAGVDGYSTFVLEHTGTEADCINGVPTYSAWWEAYPAAPARYSDPVRPGDQITATVSYAGSSSVVMTLMDSTQGWTKTARSPRPSGPVMTSAEVIVGESPFGGTTTDLADFGTVNFKDCTTNLSTLGSVSPNRIVMVGSGGTVRAQPGTISGSTFSDTWQHA
ncbi:G1 family glutamic endopeptidase [Streptomyces sp. NPDC048277]|uniref:G1 family glutamic endopeptidase n=1 Tax=Streptomyces sp. NPDC048277 TaxID=3155027 RepID=UPI0033F75E9C